MLHMPAQRYFEQCTTAERENMSDEGSVERVEEQRQAQQPPWLHQQQLRLPYLQLQCQKEAKEEEEEKMMMKMMNKKKSLRERECVEEKGEDEEDKEKKKEKMRCCDGVHVKAYDEDDGILVVTEGMAENSNGSSGNSSARDVGMHEEKQNQKKRKHYPVSTIDVLCSVFYHSGNSPFQYSQEN